MFTWTLTILGQFSRGDQANQAPHLALSFPKKIEKTIIETILGELDGGNIIRQPNAFIRTQDDAVFGKSHRKGADSIVDANTGVTDAWIVKVQKTINQGALRLEGNKLISVAVQP
ncbi:MAG TPA: hypothetical protein DIU35_01445 [Candidatus Latescibacteria bacterium]|nr:hypothetical protein [Candidatus Latescibacterota bacterium]